MSKWYYYCCNSIIVLTNVRPPLPTISCTLAWCCWILICKRRLTLRLFLLFSIVSKSHEVHLSFSFLWLLDSKFQEYDIFSLLVHDVDHIHINTAFQWMLFTLCIHLLLLHVASRTLTIDGCLSTEININCHYLFKICNYFTLYPP